MNKEREVARVTEAEVGLEDHGILTLFLRFEFDGSSQGLGCYAIDESFLYRVLDCFGVDRISAIKGMSCWVTHDMGKVYRVEPLHKKDGKPFDLEAWSRWVEAHPERQMSPYELRTGNPPFRG